MTVGAKLEIRQTQALAMTRQLQQAIRLLQLSSLELGQYVEQELEQNPILERSNSDGMKEAANLEDGNLKNEPQVDALGEALKDRCQVAGKVPDGEVPAAVAGKLRLAGDTDSPGSADVLRRQRQRLDASTGSPATPAAHATVTAGPRHPGGSSESAAAASAEMMETELPCGTCAWSSLPTSHVSVCM